MGYTTVPKSNMEVNAIPEVAQYGYMLRARVYENDQLKINYHNHGYDQYERSCIHNS